MRTHNPFTTVAGLSLALAVGCGGGGDSTPPADMATPPDMTQPADMVPVYPPEPYGPNIGDTLQNFTFQGYWSPTDTTGLASAKTFGPVTYDMLRTSKAKYALIELAAYW